MKNKIFEQFALILHFYLYICNSTELEKENMFLQLTNNNWWRSQLLQVVSQVVVS